MAMRLSGIAIWRPSWTISRFRKTSPLAITTSPTAVWLSSSRWTAPAIPNPGPARPGYLEDSPQFRWMQTEFAKPHPLWVIPYFHHPMFTAGPEHPPSLEQLRHWFRLFTNSGVKVVFSGHEHNFQASEVSPATGGIRFFVSGAGGELRRGNVQKNMQNAHIQAWAEQNHFLEVDIDGKTMKVTPLSYEPLNIVDSAGAPVAIPFTVTLT